LITIWRKIWSPNASLNSKLLNCVRNVRHKRVSQLLNSQSVLRRQMKTNQYRITL
jgi:hypothetical protein